MDLFSRIVSEIPNMLCYYLLKTHISSNSAIQDMCHKFCYTSSNPFHNMNPILCWIINASTLTSLFGS